jgi:hypothetical protein
MSLVTALPYWIGNSAPFGDETGDAQKCPTI